MKHTISTLYVFWILVGPIWANPPYWEIDPQDYEFSMTLTAVARIEGIESVDTADRVAAWIDGELHGTTGPLLVNETGRFYFLMLVYGSQDAEFSEVTFTYYDASIDTVLSLINLEDFKDNNNKGNFSSPYILTTDTVTSGVEDVFWDKIYFYPNPCPGKFQVGGNERISSINVFDQTGHTVTVDKSGVQEYFLRDSVPGLYFIKVDYLNTSRVLQLQVY